MNRNKTTDTNQASKDDLVEILETLTAEAFIFGNLILGKSVDIPLPDDNHELPPVEKALVALQSLIRTEKLKLLAEVRERVVGEDVELNGFEIPMFEEEFVITSVTQQNNLRAAEIAKARLNEVQNAYEYWINGRNFMSSYFRDRIALLSNTKEGKDE